MSGSLAKSAGRESSHEELHLGMHESGDCQPGTNGCGSLPLHSGNSEPAELHAEMRQQPGPSAEPPPNTFPKRSRATAHSSTLGISTGLESDTAATQRQHTQG